MQKKSRNFQNKAPCSLPLISNNIVIAKVSNQCSTTPTIVSSQGVIVNTSGCPGFSSFNVNSNPASGEITITPKENNTAKAAAKNIKEVKIFDNAGVLKSTNKYNATSNTVKIGVNNLPIGNYQISILTNDGWETTPLIIVKQF